MSCAPKPVPVGGGGGGASKGREMHGEMGEKKERADSWEKVQSVSVGELVKANIFWK